MKREISFTKTEAILVETETMIETISSGVVLLTLDQATEAKRHGWKLFGEKPFSKETEPWLYSVKKG